MYFTLSLVETFVNINCEICHIRYCRKEHPAERPEERPGRKASALFLRQTNHLLYCAGFMVWSFNTVGRSVARAPHRTCLWGKRKR